MHAFAIRLSVIMVLFLSVSSAQCAQNDRKNVSERERIPLRVLGGRGGFVVATSQTREAERQAFEAARIARALAARRLWHRIQDITPQVAKVMRDR